MNDTSDPHGLRGRLKRLSAFIAFTARLRAVERPNNATATRRESVAEHSWHLAMVSWILHAEFEREAGFALDLPRMLKLCLMHDLVEFDNRTPSAWQRPYASAGPADVDPLGGNPVERAPLGENPVEGDPVDGAGAGINGVGLVGAAVVGSGAVDPRAVDSGAHGAGGAEDADEFDGAEETPVQDRFSSLPGALGDEFLGLWHEYEEGRTPEACLVRGVDRFDPALMRYLTGQGWQDVATDTATPLDAEALDRLHLPRVAVSRALRLLYEEVRDASVRRGLVAPAPPDRP